VTEIGLVELTEEEELRAVGRAGNQQFKLAYELPKACLYSVNGDRVREGDGSKDRAWRKMPRKLRDLVAHAFAQIHNAQADDLADFTRSRRVTA